VDPRRIDDGRNFLENGKVVLRVADDESARRWCEQLTGADGSMPGSIEVLASGHNRVELGRADAEEAISWAQEQPGWDDVDAPLFIYDPSRGRTSVAD
jgi:hypothetical protein